jgi:hypothetical protein
MVPIQYGSQLLLDCEDYVPMRYAEKRLSQLIRPSVSMRLSATSAYAALTGNGHLSQTSWGRSACNLYASHGKERSSDAS